MASSPARVAGDQAPVALPADLPMHLTASLVTNLDEGEVMATSSLAAALAAVPDVRHRRRRRHELTGGLALAAWACLTGARADVAIREWAAAQGGAVLDCLADGPGWAALPCEATLRRCLQATDAAGAGCGGGRLGRRAAGRPAGGRCSCRRSGPAGRYRRPAGHRRRRQDAARGRAPLPPPAGRPPPPPRRPHAPGRRPPPPAGGAAAPPGSQPPPTPAAPPRGGSPAPPSPAGAERSPPPQR